MYFTLTLLSFAFFHCRFFFLSSRPSFYQSFISLAFFSLLFSASFPFPLSLPSILFSFFILSSSFLPSSFVSFTHPFCFPFHYSLHSPFFFPPFFYPSTVHPAFPSVYCFLFIPSSHPSSLAPPSSSRPPSPFITFSLTRLVTVLYVSLFLPPPHQRPFLRWLMILSRYLSSHRLLFSSSPL